MTSLRGSGGLGVLEGQGDVGDTWRSGLLCLAQGWSALSGKKKSNCHGEFLKFGVRPSHAKNSKQTMAFFFSFSIITVTPQFLKGTDLPGSQWILRMFQPHRDGVISRVSRQMFSSWRQRQAGLYVFKARGAIWYNPVSEKQK